MILRHMLWCRSTFNSVGPLIVPVVLRLSLQAAPASSSWVVALFYKKSWVYSIESYIKTYISTQRILGYMTLGKICYRREDILQYKISNTSRYQVINGAILDELCHYESLHPESHGLLRNKRTWWGRRAGRHYKKSPVISSTTDVGQSVHVNKLRGKLSTILYTNWRSLSQWKLEEMKAYSELHQPDFICLTETWLNADKEKARQLDGYNNFFCKNRIGEGVGILARERLKVTHLTSHTTKTFLALWSLLHDNKYPIIIGCTYHRPNADNNTPLDYISDTLLNLLQKRPSSQVITCGDFNRLPLSDLSEQAGLRNLVDFNTREGSMLL